MTAPKLSVETANGRYYYHPRKSNQVPSITNIKKVRNVPPINTWRVNEAARYAAENIEMLQPLPERERFQLIKSSPYRPSESGKVGDMVHDWIDRWVKGETIPENEIQEAPQAAKRTLNSFWAFNRKYQPKYNNAEFTVWSDRYGYAGTADLDITMPSGKRTLVDTKSGNAVYWDIGLQLAPLAKADFILDEDGNEQPLPEFQAFAGLHLRPMSFQLIPVHCIDECFKAFLGLKTVFDLEINYADRVLEYAPKIKTSTVPVEGE
jgi:hypothetical protein